ncbi:BRCA1-A complex subunit BRE like [Actinidia chinensis var. chinensis]|uniref:BRISC and BRCA1-A complex member 2 n=1 Tax=Actinidia chinensis var. chinensis TaxID=1590841 RepID=A0A2R6R8R9_ACTCC|nr:BRCA1-A complex subunit BRE like [Actinidia chinensis var. chinensis]
MAINTVPPLIAAQLNYLLSNSPLPINVEQMWSGSKHHGLLDRFTLVIPFCLDYIRWDVIYNALYPLAAPDIIFGPEDESFRPYHVGGGDGDLKSPRKSLSDWNCKDPTWLLSLILELRELYMTYQRKRVGEVDDERLKFELSTIVPREGIEMYMRSGIEKTEEVKFAVPLLGVDINKMVTGCPWRHQQKIFLEVIFPVGRKYRHAPSTPRLKLVASPELKALFSTEDFRLPPWLDDMCMAEYLPILEGLLQSQIVDAVSSIDVRRKFIVALAPLFGRPVEADPVFCRKVAFLTSSGVFTFLVHFSLPLQFPKQQPVLMLQSSQHFNPSGAPIKSPVITEFPWSSTWESSEMAERFFDFLVEECLNFKKYCNESLLQQR